MKTTNNNLRNLVSAGLILVCLSGFSQDLLITKSNQKMNVKVIEIGTTEIKFKYFDAQDGPTVTMKKSDVKTLKIKGKNGDNTMDMGNNDPMSTSHNMILDKTSSLKFHFFSPLNNHLALSYEWMNKPGFNWEVGLGIIGAGSNGLDLNEAKPMGVFLRGGPKFLLGNSSDFEVEGLRYAHPLKGRYFKPEITLSTFTTSYQIDTSYNWSNPAIQNDNIDVKNSYQSITLNLIYGRQIIVGNSITMGYYMGMGYSIESMNSNLNSSDIYYGWDSNRYSHLYTGKDLPLSFTGGFNVGYIFKTPQINSNSKNRKVSPSRMSMK